jgi:antirestriction protein ArdC
VWCTVKSRTEGEDCLLRGHPRAEHAAYISFWIKILKDDPRAIFTAASKAQAAADWMHAQQSRQTLTSNSIDIGTIAVPLAQPEQAMH